jgi:hypothetical protein
MGTAAGKRFANVLLPSSVSPLAFAVTASEDAEYAAAIQSAIAGAAKVLSAEMEAGDWSAPNVATNFLRQNSLSKLTGDLAETTKDRLRNAIADAWDKGGSYDQIVGAIQDTVEQFSSVRAGMIAQTETNDAYNEGRDAMARSAGLSEKSWETESGNPCEVCLGNVDDGWIDIDDTFSSGDVTATAHPGCMCALNYRGTR